MRFFNGSKRNYRLNTHGIKILQLPWLALLRHRSRSVDNIASASNVGIRDIASLFQHWHPHPEIGRRREEMESAIENIHEVLSQGREREGFNIENALTQLNVRLTEEYIVKVLKHHKDDVLLGLKFFDWALRYQHTGAAYYTILKMLSQANLTRVMLDWLDSFQKQRRACGERYYKILIAGYAFAGEPELALQFFARMRFQGLDLDKISYNALLNGLVEQNCFDVVEIIYRQICRGRFRNASCDSIMITSLCKQGKLEEAKRLFDDIRHNGCTVDEAAIVVLISAFFKGKRTDEARKLIEEIRKERHASMPKVHDAWIKALVEGKRVDDALKYFEERTPQGFIPGWSCYNALISGLLGKKRLDKAYTLLIGMKNKYVFPDSNTMNALVCAFCRGGLLLIALDFFNRRSKLGFFPDNVAYNHLINALCRDRKLDTACRVLDDEITSGFTPSKQTYFTLVKTLHKAGKLDEMQELIDKGIKGKDVPSNSTCTTFISALCKAGRVEDIYLVPRKLRRANVILNKDTYSGLIKGFCLAKKAGIASKLLLEMQQYGHCPSRNMFKLVIKVLCELGYSDQVLQLLDMHMPGHPPNAKIYNLFINGLCNAGHPDIARQVYDKMHENGCLPISNNHICLLHGYVKCQDLVDALTFFEALSRSHPPSTRLYSVLISGLCKAGKVDLALAFFEEMTAKALIPRLECCEELICVLCKLGMFNTALKIFIDMNVKCRRSSTFIYNILLMHSFKLQQANQARVLFQLLHGQGFHPIVGMYSMSFDGLSDAWNSESSLGLLEELIEQSFVPNIFTYNILIGTLCKEGKMEAACSLFNNMSKKGYAPNMLTYDILVHGFCRVRRVNEAYKLMEEMTEKGFRPSQWTYNLFKALTNKGQ